MTRSEPEESSSTFPPVGTAFEFGKTVVSYTDLSIVGMLSGLWEPFVSRSRLGWRLAAERQVDKAALRLQAENFRRARRLEAAEDLRSWLAERTLSQADWRGSLERMVLVSSWDGEPVAEDLSSPPDVLRVDAFCTGFWEETAGLATRWLAATRVADAAPPSDGDPPAASGLAASLGVEPSRVEAIAPWKAAFESVRGSVASDEAVERLIRRKELDWTSFEFDELTLATREAACEALLCVRDDNLELEEIEVRSRGELKPRTGRSDCLPTTLSAELHAAGLEDSVIGPLQDGGRWSIIRLRKRNRPTKEDPAINSGAVGELVDSVLERQLAGQVRWIGTV